MLHIYNSLKYFNEDEIIIDSESFFNNNVASRHLTEKSLEVMKTFDNAELLDVRTGKMETPFGITSIYDLSTGCKTVIVCIWLMEHPDVYPTVKGIDATLCGWNAIEEIFKFLEESGMQLGVVIEHDNLLFKCSDRDYMVNNERHITSMFDFY